MAQIQPCSGAGLKVGAGLHSQGLWMVDIKGQINAGVPIAMASIGFFEMSFKAQGHICYTSLLVQTGGTSKCEQRNGGQ